MNRHTIEWAVVYAVLIMALVACMVWIAYW